MIGVTKTLLIFGHPPPGLDNAELRNEKGRLLNDFEEPPSYSALSTCYFLRNLKQTKQMTRAGADWAGISPLRAAVTWASARIFSIDRHLRPGSAGNAESAGAPCPRRRRST